MPTPQSSAQAWRYAIVTGDTSVHYMNDGGGGTTPTSNVFAGKKIVLGGIWWLSIPGAGETIQVTNSGGTAFTPDFVVRANGAGVGSDKSWMTGGLCFDTSFGIKLSAGTIVALVAFKPVG